MDSAAAVLDRVVSDLDLLLREHAADSMPDAERLDVLLMAGDALRRIEAVIVETVATAEPEFPREFGCRNLNELLQRALGTDSVSAARIAKASKAVHRPLGLASGERLPARWPHMRQAMIDGAIGVAGILAATGPLEQAGDRIAPDDRLRADAELAAQARGLSTTSADADTAPLPSREPGGHSLESPAPPATPDDLRQLAHLMAMYLDPDGSEPTEIRASAKRFLSIGRMRDGVFPIRGSLLPETCAQLELIIDAQLNPRVAGPADTGVLFRTDEQHHDIDPFGSDPRNIIDARTRGQKQHDALAAALGIAARHEDMPSLGGAAPTLVVHADIHDVASGHGWARIPGIDEPVPLAVATHTACAGGVQRVLFDEGRIVGITTTDRVFTVHQRRAVVARDRECLVPGCHVPASWCEIHHVTEHARGGPTTTDNGVPLCWHHHRTLDRSGWEIRMADGIPQIRGPAWWDPARRWRAPRASAKAFAPSRT